MTTVSPNKIIAALLEVADIAHRITWDPSTNCIDQMRESLSRLGTLPYDVLAGERHMTGPGRARHALKSFLEDAPKPELKQWIPSKGVYGVVDAVKPTPLLRMAPNEIIAALLNIAERADVLVTGGNGGGHGAIAIALDALNVPAGEGNRIACTRQRMRTFLEVEPKSELKQWIRDGIRDLGVSASAAAAGLGALGQAGVTLVPMIKSYEEWLSVGQQLHAESGGSSAAYTQWQAQSKIAGNYDPQMMIATWHSFTMDAGVAVPPLPADKFIEQMAEPNVVKSIMTPRTQADIDAETQYLDATITRSMNRLRDLSQGADGKPFQVDQWLRDATIEHMKASLALPRDDKGFETAYETLSELNLAVGDAMKNSPNTIYTTGTDASGKAVYRGARSSFNAAHELQMVDSFMTLEEAVSERGVKFTKPHKVGAVWISSSDPAEAWRNSATVKEQLEAGALTNVWEALGAINQTEAMQAIERLLKIERGDVPQDFTKTPADWMRKAVFAEMKERLALPSNDEAAIGPFETLLEMNSIAGKVIMTDVYAGIAHAIDYPAEWDTACYDTIESALKEMYAWFKINKNAIAEEEAAANAPLELDVVAFMDQPEETELAAMAEALVPFVAEDDAPQHDLYKDGDKDIPEQLVDRNGQVVLAQCKRCKRAESELSQPCMPRADWAMCMKIADEPQVDEAVRGFLQDQSGNNVVCLVRDIVDAVDQHRALPATASKTIINLDKP
jgi:hypothetical protein